MKTITTRAGHVILVDDEDHARLSAHCWHVTAKGYAARNVTLPDGRRGLQLMHREVMGLPHGDKIQVDHKFGRKLDNRKSELRIATHADNEANRGIPINNTSGFKGVYWHEKAHKWMAAIGHKGKQEYLGLFDTPEDAHEFRCLAAEMLHGNFARHTW